MFIIKGMISGYIEFHTDDTELVKTIFGDKIAEISKSDYPTTSSSGLKMHPRMY